MNNHHQNQTLLTLEPDPFSCVENKARMEYNRISGELLEKEGSAELEENKVIQEMKVP